MLSYDILSVFVEKLIFWLCGNFLEYSKAKFLKYAYLLDDNKIKICRGLCGS